MKIAKVNALQNYKLSVSFDDGISGEIDLNGFVNLGIFAVLKDPELFNIVYTNGYSVAWNDEREIDALAIYTELSEKRPGDIISTKLKYASN